MAEQSAADSLKAVMERGTYLANNVATCLHCHADRDFTKFAGPVIPGTEGKGGRQIMPGIYVRNITPYALGDWTDEEIYQVLTTGIRKNGDTLFPIMPYANYAKMPREEVYSIIAWLRSLAPIEHNVPARDLTKLPPGILAEAYNKFYIPHAEKKLSPPPPDDLVARGAYLVNAGDCEGCHSPFDDAIFDFKTDEHLSGGEHFKPKDFGFEVTSANLTPDTATGLGGWTEETFLAKFRHYRDSSGYCYDAGKYNSIMPWTQVARMDDEDLKAIYAYLRTVKPVSKRIQKWQ